MADDYLRRNAVRLLREKWASPSALAEELYMIHSDEASRTGNAVSPVAQARAEAVARQAVEVAEPNQTRPATKAPAPPNARPLAEYLESIASQFQAATPALATSALLPAGYSPTAIPFSSLPTPVPPIRSEQPSSRRTPSSPEPIPSIGGLSFSSGVLAQEPLTDFAHVEWSDPNAGYPPLGLPSAYSGLERAAGSYNPADGPVYREVAADDPFARRYYDLRFPVPDFDSARPSGGGGTSTYIGQVVDGSASPDLQVLLFPDGPDADPGDTVTVTILQLADGEIVPNGTWLTGIQQTGSTYNAQVPIWLD